MPGSLPISDELSELVRLLNFHGVEYLVVGAHALAFHGVPRFTEDIAFWVAKRSENIDRLAGALEEFGVDVPLSSRGEMVKGERGMIFIGHKPNRADFLNFLDGLNFDSAVKSRLPGQIAGQPVYFLSLPDYVATKKASGRPKDTGDIALLKTVHPEIEV